MDAPTPPPAPDPAVTAAAQAKANKETAVTQYGLNATNQVTPEGTLSYRQIGTWADGTPRFESTTAYTPAGQQLADTQNQIRQNVGNIGVEQSAKVGNILNTPVNLSNEATEARLMDLGRKRLDPKFEQDRAALENRLYNQGVRPGTQAYNDAMTQLQQGQNDAYNQLLLSGRGQATQEALTERNQPLNEISALMSGSQVSQPNFINTPQPGVAPTDYISAVGQNLAQQNVGYNAKVQNQIGLMNGLFGLGSTALGGWMKSDKRLKTDIKKVGKLDGGLPIYSFRYKDGEKGGLMQLGLMAQDVERTMPEAVAQFDDVGHKAVNYSMVAEALNG